MNRETFVNLKFSLFTARGKEIPSYSVQEAVEQRIIDSPRESELVDFEEITSQHYAALTETFSLPREEAELISICEQLREKPYFVIYEESERITRAVVYIPKLPKRKVVF